MHHGRKEHVDAPEDSAARQKIRKNGHGSSCVRSYTACASMSLHGILLFGLTVLPERHRYRIRWHAAVTPFVE